MSPEITITSEELRERVEDRLDRWIPDDVWNRAEPYARHKNEVNRQRHPEIDYYDNDYLVLLTADTVRETERPSSATSLTPSAIWPSHGLSERRNQWKPQKKGPPVATGRPMREDPAACQHTDPAPQV